MFVGLLFEAIANSNVILKAITLNLKRYNYTIFSVLCISTYIFKPIYKTIKHVTLIFKQKTKKYVKKPLP